MPQTPHTERHFTAGAVVRDIVIGMSDGLTVPFALAAGLTGAISSTEIIVTAGLAEIAAGSIAMGLGGYLAAKSDAEHYAKEREREKREVAEIPHEEMREVAEVFQAYGLTEDETWPIVQALRRQPKNWIDFMMRFELGLEKPDPKRALTSALTIGGAYIAGGMIPLAPYIFASETSRALLFSVGLTLFALLAFGFVKGTFHGNETCPQRIANCINRECRRRRRVWNCESDRRLNFLVLFGVRRQGAALARSFGKIVLGCQLDRCKSVLKRRQGAALQRLLPGQHNWRLFGGADLFVETAHLLILISRNRSGLLRECAFEYQLAVLYLVSCLIGTERSVEFDWIRQLINIEGRQAT